MTQSTQLALKSRISFRKQLHLLNRKNKAYGIQSPPRQSSSSVYSLDLGTEGKSHRRGANELAWKTILSLFWKWT